MNTLSEATLKRLRKTYDEYEDRNEHLSNYLLLATFFGTDEDKEEVKKIITRRNRRGYLTQKENTWLYENINPYYDHLRNVKAAETFEAEGILCYDCPMAARHVVIRKDHTDEEGNLICPFCHSNKNFKNISETTYLLHGGRREDLRAESIFPDDKVSLRVWAKDVEKDHLGYFVSKNKDGWETWRGLCGITSDKGKSRGFNVSNYDGSYGRRCRKCLTAYKKMGEELNASYGAETFEAPRKKTDFSDLPIQYKTNRMNSAICISKPDNSGDSLCGKAQFAMYCGTSVGNEISCAKCKSLFTKMTDEEKEKVRAYGDSPQNYNGAETFEARYNQNGTIAYNEKEWAGDLRNERGAVFLGSDGGDKYFYLHKRIVKVVKGLKNETLVQPVIDFNDYRLDDLIDKTDERRKLAKIFDEVMKNYDRHTDYRRAETFGKNAKGEYFRHFQSESKKTKYGMIAAGVITAFALFPEIKKRF